MTACQGGSMGSMVSTSKGGGGGVEEEGKKVAAFAEDAAQDLGDGEPSRREASETDCPEGRPARAD